jgi:hypothetical protein
MTSIKSYQINLPWRQILLAPKPPILGALKRPLMAPPLLGATALGGFPDLKQVAWAGGRLGKICIIDFWIWYQAFTEMSRSNPIDSSLLFYLLSHPHTPESFPPRQLSQIQLRLFTANLLHIPTRQTCQIL